MVQVNVQLNLKDTVARDLFRASMSKQIGATVLVGAVNGSETQMTFRDTDKLAVGSLVLFPDTGETVKISALPTIPGGTYSVVRVSTGDVSVPGLPTEAAAPHADQQQVFILQFQGLVDMGVQAAEGVIQNYITAMGNASETIGAALLAKQQADAALQGSLDDII